MYSYMSEPLPFKALIIEFAIRGDERGTQIKSDSIANEKYTRVVQ